MSLLGLKEGCDIYLFSLYLSNSSFCSVLDKWFVVVSSTVLESPLPTYDVYPSSKGEPQRWKRSKGVRGVHLSLDVLKVLTSQVGSILLFGECWLPNTGCLGGVTKLIYTLRSYKISRTSILWTLILSFFLKSKQSFLYSSFSFY